MHYYIKMNMNINITVAIPRYPASTLDWDKVGCRLTDQDMRLSSRYTQYPDVNILVSGHAPQFASVYVMSLSMEEGYKCKPYMTYVVQQVCFYTWSKNWMWGGVLVKSQSLTLVRDGIWKEFI